MLTEIEKKVIAALQEDIPIDSRPYLKMAADIGIDEDKFIETLSGLCQKKVIRRFGATIRHQKSGFKANAMTAWAADENKIENAGKIMASSKNISHCYKREPAHNWPYNLYTMIHGKSVEDCRAIAKEMSKKTGIKNYTMLFSDKELKKTSMIYFK